MDSSGITTDFQFILTDTTKNDNVSNIPIKNRTKIDKFFV